MNYLLVGQEHYNLENRLQQLIETAVGKENPLAVSFYDGNKDVEVRDIIEDCNTPAFLTDKKVVVYQNPDCLENDDLNQLELLIHYGEKPNSSTEFILTYSGNLSDHSAAFKKLSLHYKLERFDYLSAEQFRHYVASDLLDNHLTLDDKTLELLMERLPNDVGNWKNELAKLQLYPGKIDRDVIRQLINKPLEDNSFEFTNAIANRDLAKGTLILRDLMVTSKNDVSSLIGLVASQFRTMSQVKIMQEQRMALRDIMDSIGTKSDYRVKMINKAIGSLSAKELMKILDDLSNLDQDIKMGKIDGVVGLELFMIKTVRR